MFGHQDNQTGQSDQGTSDTGGDDTSSTLSDQLKLDSSDSKASNDTDTSPDLSTPSFQHPGEALDDTKKPKDDVISPAGGFPTPLSSKEPALGPVSAPSLHGHSPLNLTTGDDNQLTDATDENLVEVKQKALNELFPLIDKLDQTPEEHFRTLMMIIQASDNHTLIEKAYQVAQTIDDEKARAQALLDIVNEINYFTQQPEV
jgi:hypothetical protein